MNNASGWSLFCGNGHTLNMLLDFFGFVALFLGTPGSFAKLKFICVRLGGEGTSNELSFLLQN